MLANQAFGKNYLTISSLNSYDSLENSQVIVVEENEEVIGFSIVMTFKQEELFKHLYIDLEIPAEESRVGYRKMTIVKPESRGKGIGSELIKKGEVFIQTKSKIVYSSIWCNGTEEKMTNLLDKNGYQFLEKRINYWKDDSLEKQYNCAICDAPPCMCAALIYKKNLTMFVQ